VFDYRAGIDENGRFRGIIQPTGLRPRFLERMSDQGVHFPNELFHNESGSVPLAMRR
jgi:pilus assembly protein CpaF